MQSTTTTFQVVCEVPTGAHVQLEVLNKAPRKRWNGGGPSFQESRDIDTEEEVQPVRASARDDEVRALFLAVAECSPELLRGVWSRLFKIVCADSGMWVYPHHAVYGVDDELDPANIDKEALSLAWVELLERARDCAVTQTSESAKFSEKACSITDFG